MVSEGAVDVLVSNPGCPEIALARLGPGQYFGEVELIHNEDSIASVRAIPEQTVELSLLPKDFFIQLLNDSPVVQNEIERVAKERLEQNISQNGDCS